MGWQGTNRGLLSFWTDATCTWACLSLRTRATEFVQLNLWSGLQEMSYKQLCAASKLYTSLWTIYNQMQYCHYFDNHVHCTTMVENWEQSLLLWPWMQQPFVTPYQDCCTNMETIRLEIGLCTICAEKEAHGQVESNHDSWVCGNTTRLFWKFLNSFHSLFVSIMSLIFPTIVVALHTRKSSEESALFKLSISLLHWFEYSQFHPRYCSQPFDFVFKFKLCHSSYLIQILPESNNMIWVWWFYWARVHIYTSVDVVWSIFETWIEFIFLELVNSKVYFVLSKTININWSTFYLKFKPYSGSI